MATRADWGLLLWLPWVMTEVVVVVAGVRREGKTATGLIHTSSNVSPSLVAGVGGGEAAGVYTPLSRGATGAKLWDVTAEMARGVGVVPFNESPPSLFAQR